jgi:hypothetical protein
MIATEVGSLWRNPENSGEGPTFSGWITLPYSLPAGTSLQAILVPVPFKRSPKEKFILHLEIPFDDPPPEPPGPDDINCDKGGGRTMSQWFASPEPSNRRDKILIWGDSGTGKTKAALSFPRCAYMDNHGSAEKYRIAYQEEHKFFPPRPDVLPTADNVIKALTTLLVDPGDRATLVLDDITTFWDQLQAKWSETFLSRLPQSKGHHAEFYSFRPSDWIHPKRELRTTLRRMIAIDMTSIAIARSQNKYAGKGTNYMEVVGQIFAGERNITYEFDFVFEFIMEGDKRFAVVHKQRITPGDKPLPERIEHHINAKGFSDFYQIFAKYVDKDRLTGTAHQVSDPVMVEGPEQQGTSPAEEIPTKEIVNPTASKSIVTTESQPEAELRQGVSGAQLDALVALKSKFNIQKDEWMANLQKFYNATSARTLTFDQAEHYINWLETQRVPF